MNYTIRFLDKLIYKETFTPGDHGTQPTAFRRSDT